MIRTSDKTLIFADKTNNMYRLSKDQYNMLLNNSITSIYKKSNNNIKKKINISGRNILVYNTERSQRKLPEQSISATNKSC